jgi:Rrf2 family protein
VGGRPVDLACGEPETPGNRRKEELGAMFSQSVEYALRAAVWLAGSDQPRKASELAECSQAPSAYLSKILLLLVRGGVAKSLRGARGGYVLSRPAIQISVLDVVAAVEPMRRIFQCPLDRPNHWNRLCPLHRCLDDALAYVEQSFRSTRLSDLVEPAGLCASVGRRRRAASTSFPTAP